MSMITAFSSPPSSGRAYTVSCSAADTAQDITESICSKYHLKVKPSQVNLHLLPACSLWAGQLEPGNSPPVGSNINIASKLLGGGGSATLLWRVGGPIWEEENQSAGEDVAVSSKSSILTSSPCLEARERDHTVSTDERTRLVTESSSYASATANGRNGKISERVSETDFEDDRHSIAGQVVLPGLHLVCNRSRTSYPPGTGIQSVEPVESMAKSEVASTDEFRYPSLPLTSPHDQQLGEMSSLEPCSHVHQNSSHLSIQSDGSCDSRDCITLESESDVPTASAGKITTLRNPVVHVISSSEEDMSANMRAIDKDCGVPAPVHHSLSIGHLSIEHTYGRTFTVPEVPITRHTETEVAEVEDSSSSEDELPEFSLVNDPPLPIHLRNAESPSLAGVRHGSLSREKPPPIPVLCSTPSSAKLLCSDNPGDTDEEREQLYASSGIAEEGPTCSILADSSILEDSRIDEGIGLESSSEDVMIVGVEGGRVRIQDEQIISVLAAELQRSPPGSSWSLRKAMRRLRTVFGREVDSRQPLVERKLKELKARPPSWEGEQASITSCGIRLTQGDLDTLQPYQWLNDQVINCYMRLLMEQGQSGRRGQRVYIVSTFFYPKLLSASYRGVERWIKNVDLLQLSLLLVPVHLGMHWCLAAINFRSGKIEYFDPLGGKNRTCLRTLLLFLLTHASRRGRSLRRHWRKCYAKAIPRQYNGSDCGVFVCQYARWLCKFKGPHSSMPFSQRHMPGIRTAMLEELKRGKFMEQNFTKEQ